MSADGMLLVIVLAVQVVAVVWAANLFKEPSAVREWYRYLRDRK